LVNLLSNAAKYSAQHTTIIIKAEVLGDNVHFSITDQGSGIPPGELTQVFTQFYRTANTASTAKGIGLGLYIAKEIVEAHFGKIWAESELGRGSTFHVMVPINRVTR
jgi:signal transduction histidine kinase